MNSTDAPRQYFAEVWDSEGQMTGQHRVQEPSMGAALLSLSRTFPDAVEINVWRDDR